jgi:hypothetical protein
MPSPDPARGSTANGALSGACGPEAKVLAMTSPCSLGGVSWIPQDLSGGQGIRGPSVCCVASEVDPYVGAPRAYILRPVQ